MGWMCYCGVRLEDATPKPTCEGCGRHYKVEANSCTEVGQKDASSKNEPELVTR